MVAKQASAMYTDLEGETKTVNVEISAERMSTQLMSLEALRFPAKDDEKGNIKWHGKTNQEKTRVIEGIRTLRWILGLQSV